MRSWISSKRGVDVAVSMVHPFNQTFFSKYPGQGRSHFPITLTLTLSNHTFVGFM